MDNFNSSSSPFPFSYPITNTTPTFITSAAASSSITTSAFINNNSSSSSSSTSWMDSRIWSHLPQQLLDRIIAFLPPPSFFRSRSVCKRWYALLFSTPFLKLYLHLSPRHHCFLFFNQTTPKQHTTVGSQGFMFDPFTLTWYRLIFPLIPSCFAPVSSSNGLICWTTTEPGPKCLTLHNPLTGSISQLPPTSIPRLFPSIGLTVTNSSVDVIVAGDDMISPYAVKNLTSESFHIDAGGFYSIWGTESSLPRLCSLESSRMVHIDSKFYSMSYSPFSIVTYDVVLNTWTKIQAPMRRFLRSPSLVENRGKLMLVAGVEKSKLNVPKSLRTWVLEGRSWVEMERMPLKLYVEFEEIENGRGFDCVGSGEFVVIMIRGCNKCLMFDFCLKRWSWIPSCPFSYGEEQLDGFGYVPKLVTPVTGLLDQLALPFQSFNV